MFILWADKKLYLTLWSVCTGQLHLVHQKLGVCISQETIYIPESDSGYLWSGFVVCEACVLHYMLIQVGHRLGWEWIGSEDIRGIGVL